MPVLKLKLAVLLLGLLLLLVGSMPTIAANDVTQVKFFAGTRLESDTRSYYYYNLLKLALHKTKPEYGRYKITLSKNGMRQSEAIEQLRNGRGEIDVIWTISTIEREQVMLPVSVPLLKGLLGFRVLMIARDRQYKFVDITEDKLKTMTATQGEDWPDTQILLSNGYKVRANQDYKDMFNAILKNRADYFPRSVTEIWRELESYSDKPLMAEPTVMLYYWAPIYFFTSRSKPELAQRIEKGLKLAIEDGSFDELFLSFPGNRKILEDGFMDNRKIFKLNNPLVPPLPPELLEPGKGLLYQPSDFKQ